MEEEVRQLRGQLADALDNTARFFVEADRLQNELTSLVASSELRIGHFRRRYELLREETDGLRRREQELQRRIDSHRADRRELQELRALHDLHTQIIGQQDIRLVQLDATLERYFRLREWYRNRGIPMFF